MIDGFLLPVYRSRTWVEEAIAVDGCALALNTRTMITERPECMENSGEIGRLRLCLVCLCLNYLGQKSSTFVTSNKSFA